MFAGVGGRVASTGYKQQGQENATLLPCESHGTSTPLTVFIILLGNQEENGVSRPPLCPRQLAVAPSHSKGAEFKCTRVSSVETLDRLEETRDHERGGGSRPQAAGARRWGIGKGRVEQGRDATSRSRMMVASGERGHLAN